MAGQLTGLIQTLKPENHLFYSQTSFYKTAADEGTSSTTRGWSDAATQSTTLDLYVDGANGSDANTGTSGAPYKTIQAAVDNINGTNNWFTKVYIQPGTYVENVAVTTQVDLLAATSTKPVIQSTNTSNYPVTLGSSSAYGTFNFTVQGLSMTGGQSGIYVQGNAKGGTIQSNTISNNTGTHGGIYLADTTAGVTITSNTIQNNPGVSGAGIYFNAATTNSTIAYNTISDNYRGVYVSNASGTAVDINNNVISGNTNGYGLYVDNTSNGVIQMNTVDSNSTANFAGIYCEDCDNSLIKYNRSSNNSSDYGIEVNSSVGITLLSNLVFNNARGIYLYGNSDNPIIRNNTIHNNTNEGLWLASDTTDYTVENNIITDNLEGVDAPNSIISFANNSVYNNSTQYVTISDQTGSNSNLDTDPLYYNVAGFDFHLKQDPPNIGVTTSPAVDTGSDTAVNLALDAGATRTDGEFDTGTVDRGYHYTGTPLPPTGLAAARNNTDRLTKVDLTWTDDSPNNDGFKIYTSLTSGVTQGSTFRGTVEGDVTNFTITGLSPGTTYFIKVFAFFDGGGSDGSNEVSITTGSAPTSPTTLYVDDTDAQTGSANPIDLPHTSTPRFSAIFNDPDSGETGTAYRIQVTTDPTFSSITHWNNTNNLANVAIGARIPDIVYAGTALTAGQNYYWRIKFTDDGGAEGVYSSGGEFFRLNTPPSAPSTLYTNTTDNGAATGNTNPVNVTDLTPEFSAVYVDNDSLDKATAYQLQVDTSNTFTTPIYDTGKVTLSTTLDQGIRIPDIEYAGPALTEGTTYYWRIRFYDEGDAEGAYSPSTNTFVIVPFQPNFAKPANSRIFASTRPLFGLERNWDNDTEFTIQIDDNSNFSSPVVDYTSGDFGTGAVTFRVGQATGSGSYLVGAPGQALVQGKYFVRTKQSVSNGTESEYTSTKVIYVDNPITNITHPSSVEFAGQTSSEDEISVLNSSMTFQTLGTGFKVKVVLPQAFANTTYPSEIIPPWTGTQGIGVTARYSSDGGTTWNYFPGDNDAEWNSAPENLTYVAPGTGAPTTILTVNALGTPSDTPTTYQVEFKYRLKLSSATSGTYTSKINYIIIPTY